VSFSMSPNGLFWEGGAGRFFALPTNIRPGWNCLPVSNSLA